MWSVYSETNSEFGGPIGRIEHDGRIYNHATFSHGYLVGRVDNEGRVYSYPQHVQYPLDDYRYEVGRVKGNIIYERYRHSIVDDSWIPFAHVGNNGIVYLNAYSEGFTIDRCGHVKEGCPPMFAAAAAFILLLPDHVSFRSTIDPSNPSRNKE